MQNFDPEKTKASMSSFDPDIWARYLLRELYDLGYNTAALALEKEACVSVDSEAMSQIRTSLHNFKWDQALHSLDNLVMRDPATLQEAKRTIAIGKYFYFLSKQKPLEEAVNALHNDLVPLYTNTADQDELQALAILLLCADCEKAVNMTWFDDTWSEKLGRIQPDQILQKLEKLVGSQETIVEGSLRQCATQSEERVAKPTKRTCLKYECVQVLMEHTDEVWNLVCSNNAQYMATSSKDGSILVWDMTRFEDASSYVEGLAIVQRMRDPDVATEHLAWSPSDTYIVSCGSNNSAIHVWNVKTGIADYIFKHTKLSASSTAWLSDEKVFLTDSADKSLVLWNLKEGDIRKWNEHVILDMQVHRTAEGARLYALTGNTVCSKDLEEPSLTHEYNIQSYDCTLLLSASWNSLSSNVVKEVILESKEPISSFSLSSDGKYLLVNYIVRQTLEVIRIEDRTSSGLSFCGFKEARYMVFPCFARIQGEAFDSLLVSGSEDGTILCWDRDSAELLCTLEGHTQTVNKVVTHPTWKNVLASASDDETVRLWKMHA